LVRKYMERSNMTISATFGVPDALLKLNGKHEEKPNL
jgi:hypothetical protein